MAGRPHGGGGGKSFMLATKNDNLQQLQYFMEYLLASSASFLFCHKTSIK